MSVNLAKRIQKRRGGLGKKKREQPMLLPVHRPWERSNVGKLLKHPLVKQTANGPVLRVGDGGDQYSESNFQAVEESSKLELKKNNGACS